MGDEPPNKLPGEEEAEPRAENPTGPELEHWTEDIETVLKRIGEESKSLAWLHLGSAKLFNWIDRGLGIPNGVLAAFLTAFSLATLSMDCPSSSPGWTKIVQAVVSFAVALLVFLQNYLGFSKRAALHSEKSSQLAGLAIDIETELSMPRYTREKPRTYVVKIRNRYKKLSVPHPSVPDFLVEKYKQKVAGKNVAQPAQVDSLQEIVINRAETPKKDQSEEVRVVADIGQRERDDPAIRWQMQRFSSGSA